VTYRSRDCTAGENHANNCIHGEPGQLRGALNPCRSLFASWKSSWLLPVIAIFAALPNAWA
jgi:hypothetical protein